MRVLPHEFISIHLHGFLTALNQAEAMLPRPRSRSRENCLTDITASDDSGQYSRNIVLMVEHNRVRTATKRT